MVLEAGIRLENDPKEFLAKGQMYGDTYLQNQDTPIKESLLMNADGLLAEISFA